MQDIANAFFPERQRKFGEAYLRNSHGSIEAIDSLPTGEK